MPMSFFEIARDRRMLARALAHGRHLDETLVEDVGVRKDARDRVLAESGLPPGFEFAPGTTVLNGPIEGRSEPEPLPGAEAVQELRERFGGGL